MKGVSFLGRHDEYVASGSDDGHLYIWSTRTGQLLRVARGDAHVVNAIEPHPWAPLHVATSGIDDTVKLWAPGLDEPAQMGAAEEELRRANSMAQGRQRQRTLVVTPAMLNMLLRQRRAAGREGERGDARPDCTIS